MRSVSARQIKREGGDLEAMKAALAELEAGRVVIIYPEGTRSPDGSLQEFKRGVLLLVKRAKPTILPMGVEGTFDAWPRGRTLPRARGKVVCVCGQPMSGEELAKLDGEQALAAMRDAVAKAHDEARALRAAWVGGAGGATRRRSCRRVWRRARWRARSRARGSVHCSRGGASATISWAASPPTSTSPPTPRLSRSRRCFPRRAAWARRSA
jgi:hypothetical protein